MPESIESKYELDISGALQSLEKLADTYEKFEQRIGQSRRLPTLGADLGGYSRFNQSLGQTITLQRQQEAAVRAVRAELEKHGGVLTDLNKRHRELTDAKKYRDLQQVVEEIRAKMQALEKQIEDTANETGKLGKRGKEAGGDFASFKNIIAGAFAADQIVEFGKHIIEITGKFERYEAVLTNALGSRSVAQQSLQMIAQYAAVTPYSVDEITDAFIKLVNRGIEPTKAQLTQLGDLAASQGKSFDQLVKGVLDAQSGEFERLKEFGIRAEKSGDQVKLSFKNVSTTVKNTSADITNAILKFGSLQGVVGSTAVVSKTLEGQISNLGDSYDRLLLAIGDSRLGSAFKGLIAVGGEYLSLVTDIIAKSPVDSLRQQQAELNGLVGAIALANDNEAVRSNLISELNQKYPEFLGKLNAESVTTDILSQRLAEVNKQYEQRIRIALGQEKINKAQDDYTASIRAQSKALGDLALASGKSVVELEKLSQAQQLQLAKDLASGKRPISEAGKAKNFTPSYFDLTVDLLERGGAAQAKSQKELNTLLGENAARQAQLTKTTVEGYDRQIKQIREKIKLNKIDKAIGEEEIKRLEAEKRRAQGLAAQQPKAATTSTNKPKTGLSPEAKAQIEEYKTLLSAQEDYQQAAAKLIEEYGKDRLETFAKDSVDYIAAKAQLDREELESERQKMEALLQIARSAKTRKDATGKFEIVPDKSVTLAKDAPEVNQYFTNRGQQITEKENADKEQLRLDSQIRMLGYERKFNELEVKENERKWKAIIKAEKEGSAEQLRLRDLFKKEQERILLGQAITQIKEQEQFDLAKIDTEAYENEIKLKAKADGKIIDLEREKERKRLAIRIKAGEELIKYLTAQGAAENALLIKQTQAAVDAAKRQQEGLNNLKVDFSSGSSLFGSLLGLEGESLDKFEAALGSIKDSIQAGLSAQIEASEQRIQLLNDEIAAKEELFRTEEERRKEGQANNAAGLKQEIENLKAQKAQEEAVRRRAVKVQQEIDLISTTSSNVAATAQMIAAAAAAFKAYTGIPFVGIALAIAAVASIYATISSFKAKAQAVTRLEKGGRIPLTGRRHAQGGHRIEGTDIEVERGEHVINAKSSEQFDEALTALNKNDPKTAFYSLMRSIGLNSPINTISQQQTELRVKMPSIVVQTTQQAAMVDRLNKVESLLAQLVEQGNRPASQMVGLGDGRVIEKEGGRTKIVDYNKK